VIHVVLRVYRTWVVVMAKRQTGGCVTPHADFARCLLIRHLLGLFMLTEMPPLFDTKAVITSPEAFFYFCSGNNFFLTSSAKLSHIKKLLLEEDVEQTLAMDIILQHLPMIYSKAVLNAVSSIHQIQIKLKVLMKYQQIMHVYFYKLFNFINLNLLKYRNFAIY
jgi:hypothetical protein